MIRYKIQFFQDIKFFSLELFLELVNSVINPDKRILLNYHYKYSNHQFVLKYSFRSTDLLDTIH
jgi:hypothetical protein